VQRSRADAENHPSAGQQIERRDQFGLISSSRSGSKHILVPILIRRVTVAATVSAINGSNQRRNARVAWDREMGKACYVERDDWMLKNSERFVAE
jgi:hypothetical protein